MSELNFLSAVAMAHEISQKKLSPPLKLLSSVTS
jgi:hypothetical protein